MAVGSSGWRWLGGMEELRRTMAALNAEQLVRPRGITTLRDRTSIAAERRSERGEGAAASEASGPPARPAVEGATS